MPAAQARNQACLSCRARGRPARAVTARDEVISLPTLAIWPSNIRPRRTLSTRMLLSGVGGDIENVGLLTTMALQTRVDLLPLINPWL